MDITQCLRSWSDEKDPIAVDFTVYLISRKHGINTCIEMLYYFCIQRDTYFIYKTFNQLCCNITPDLVVFLGITIKHLFLSSAENPQNR